MKKSIICFLSLFAVLFVSGCAMPFVGGVKPLPKGAVPPRVAVVSFKDRSSFKGNWDLGSGLADLLVSELVASKNFVVLERGNLAAVVDEIMQQKHRLFRKEGKVSEGRLENAKYLIRGVVTDFSQTSGGSFWMSFRKVFIGSGGYTARVGLALTIVDIESGRIVNSVQCSGEAKAGEVYGKGAYEGVRLGGSKFFKTPLGNATAEAMRSGLKGIIKEIPIHYWKPMIADLNLHQIVLNGGANRGFKVDQYYRVRKKGSVVTDPGTGDVLDVLPGAVVGVIRVIEVRERVAGAEVVSGHSFARGQVMERVHPPKVRSVELGQ